MESLKLTIALEQSSNGDIERSIAEAFLAVVSVLASHNFLVSVLSTEFDKNAWPPMVHKLSLYQPSESVVIHAKILPDTRFVSFKVVFHAGEEGTLAQIRPVFDEFLMSLKTHHSWLARDIIL